jgi:hypothetical protein
VAHDRDVADLSGLVDTHAYLRPRGKENMPRAETVG